LFRYRGPHRCPLADEDPLLPRVFQRDRQALHRYHQGQFHSQDHLWGYEGAQAPRHPRHRPLRVRVPLPALLHRGEARRREGSTGDHLLGVPPRDTLQETHNVCAGERARTAIDRRGRDVRGDDRRAGEIKGVQRVLEGAEHGGLRHPAVEETSVHRGDTQGASDEGAGVAGSGAVPTARRVCGLE